jgi:hypothetical protein
VDYALSNSILLNIKNFFQLQDLRHVIARMLGLNADSLAVPDYEIISRIERLVEGRRRAWESDEL